MSRRAGVSRWPRTALAAGVLASAAACDSILAVDDSAVILPADIVAAGSAAVPAIVHGLVGTYQEAVDDIIRYAALLTDEMVASETFDTRLQVDVRRIQVGNSTLEGAMYAPLHQARMQADTAVVQLQARLQDGAFQSVLADMHEGIALGKLYGGYTRVWLAEIYCWSILTGLFPEDRPMLPNARVTQALSFLQEAEATAGAAGLTDIRLAAIVGQARAHLWLRNYAQAATLAARVPSDFIYWAEYSDNEPEQYNEMYMVTWGDNEAIRWTVGDGSISSVGNERWQHLDEFVALNLLRVEPDGFSAFNSRIPVVLQTLYSRPESSVMMASGVEATLIRAEAAVRSAQTAVAEQLLNGLRAYYSQRALLQWRVKPPAASVQLQPLTLSGDTRTDLQTIARARARELWLTGDRLTTSRRFRLEPLLGINLFPPVKTSISGGDDIAFPIPQVELDANPKLTAADACPAGQAAGFWR